MSVRIFRTAVAAVLMVVMLAICTNGALALSADVVMKVSRSAQDSIVNAGEDLTIDLVVDGVAPASYLWYFQDEPIPGANYAMYSIVSATPADAGIYRVDAFDAEGSMLLSMEFNVRVVENVLPKSGDATLDAWLLLTVMGAAGLTMGGTIVARKKRLQRI